MSRGQCFLYPRREPPPISLSCLPAMGEGSVDLGYDPLTRVSTFQHMQSSTSFADSEDAGPSPSEHNATIFLCVVCSSINPFT